MVYGCCRDASHRGINALLARHPLGFFVLAFAGTWLTELPYVLFEDGYGLLPFSSPLLIWTAPVCVLMGPFLGGFGAFALVLVALTRGLLGYRPEAEAPLTDTSGGPRT